ncbi:MAG: hypothetical protein IMZ50_16450 [Candidatus Atribacteria bacterium]|nr:hypothetical protein [Candidatus Atribacteria bacterium]
MGLTRILIREISFEDTDVTCTSCGATFPWSDLSYGAERANNDSGFPREESFEVCPECGALDCCKIEFETEEQYNYRTEAEARAEADRRNKEAK